MIDSVEPTAGDAGRAAGPIRVALAGAGYVARFHLEILKSLPGVEVVAVADLDRDRAADAARRWGVPHAVASIEELPALGVEIAHVLTPPDQHVPVARKLLELGIGILLEKPAALDAASIQELGRLAARLGLPLGVNHNQVYHPAFSRLMAAVRAGRIGRVEHVRLSFSVPLAQLATGDFSHWMFRAPENILFEQGPHPLSQVHALAGPLVSATATILQTRELAPGRPFHERFLLAAQGERATAEVYLAFGATFTRSEVEVLGSDGSLTADLAHNLFAAEEKAPYLDFWNSFLAGWRRGGALRRGALSGLSRYGRYTLGIGRRDDAYFASMRESLRAFYAAVAKGAPPPVGALEAAEVLAWCEAAAAEARRRSPRGHSMPAPMPAPRPLPATARPARPGEIAVLGAGGFIGRRLVSRLLAAGAPVTAVARRPQGLPPELLGPAAEGTLRVVPGRLEDPASLAAALSGAEVVVHLATGSGETWEEVRRAMVDGSVAAARAAFGEGVRRFLYVSSIAALYAGPDCGAEVLEDSLATDPEPDGRDVYSRGKIAAEAALLALRKETGLPLVIARPGVVLGSGKPMQHSGLGLWVKDNHCVGWGMGDHPLPLVTADDVADALARLALFFGDALDGTALNLCSRVPLSAREVVAELGRATGRRMVFHPRPLWLSQGMEIGKWLVKRAGRRQVPFPSYRDLKSRSLAPAFSSRTAREVLGWRPVEEREAFLDQAVRVHGQAPGGPARTGEDGGEMPVEVGPMETAEAR